MDKRLTPEPIELVSQRLRLVALTPQLAEWQVCDRQAFFKALGVEPEPVWPPEQVGDGDISWIRDELKAHPQDAGWYCWVYISSIMKRLLGAGGFKGAPDETGTVEIGYSMLTSYREQGLATEAVMALLDWAYRDDRVRTVVAHTRDDRDASHRVLEKAGFRQTRRFRDEAADAGVIAWAHDRSRMAA